MPINVHTLLLAALTLAATACGGPATPDASVTETAQPAKECDCGEADLDSPPPASPEPPAEAPVSGDQPDQPTKSP